MMMARGRAKQSSAQARMLRYEVLNEWRGLEEMSALWRSATDDPGSGELADVVSLKVFGEVAGDLGDL
jgi:hypothetical protein